MKNKLQKNRYSTTFGVDPCRVCFKFDETTGDASDVIIEDYH